MSTFSKGQRVAGRFLLLENLGQGSEGEVWRALDDRRATQVAIKLVAADHSEHERVWESFQRQHRLASRIDHPRVLRIDAPVRDEHALVLPMTLASGDSRVLRGKSWTMSIRALRDVAEGLAAVHAAGVVHRDLKPANILLDFSGRAWIADWGAAAVDGEVTGAAAGSPFSASPAQRRGESPTPLDDLYGLGALAYEWLSGYPPFFPSAPTSADRREVPLLQSTRPAPAALTRLVMALLSWDPDRRPADADAVSRSLHELATEPAEPLVVSPPIPIVAEMPAARPDGRSPGRSRGVWWTIGSLCVLLGGVFGVLPRFATPVDLPSTPPAPVTAMDSRDPALEQQRQAYLELAARYTELLDDWESRGAGVWGGAEFAAAKSLGELGLDAGAQREYVLGRDRLEVARQRLERVTADVPRVIASRLAEGRTAIDEGRLPMARIAFELVAQADPGNVEAARGLARIAALEPILPVLVKAEADALAGRTLEALQGYEQVLRVDGDNTMAKAGLARARSTIGSDRYARAIGEALAALRNDRLDQARSALSTARGLRPAGGELAEVSEQLRAAGQRRDLDGARSEIESLERAERWAEALARYEALLVEEPSLQFAQQGRLRVASRARLVERLDDLISRPERLAAPEVRREAGRWLAEAAKAPAPAEQTRARAARVAELLGLYDRPIRTVVQSDGLTEVAIQRLGSLGVFTRREITLKPGRYVVTGIRTGYRDVRREVLVTPTTEGVVIDVRCTETTT